MLKARNYLDAHYRRSENFLPVYPEDKKERDMMAKARKSLSGQCWVPRDPFLLPNALLGS